jgi:hypothetical protein
VRFAPVAGVACEVVTVLLVWGAARRGGGRRGRIDTTYWLVGS